MSDTLPEIRVFLEQTSLPFEVWPCDPELADTAVFCEHYGVALENSANAILVRSKTGAEKFTFGCRWQAWFGFYFVLSGVLILSARMLPVRSKTH